MAQWEVKTRYGPPEVFDDAYDAADHITQNDEYIDELEVDVDESLDESYGSIEICGETFYASRILYSLDEDTYYNAQSEEKRSYAESNTDWVADELRRMDDGEEKTFEGGIRVTFTAIPDEDDENDGFDDEGFGAIFQ